MKDLRRLNVLPFCCLTVVCFNRVFVMEFKDLLRKNNLLARALTFGMIPLLWRISISIGRWLGYADNLLVIGIAGIWLGVLIGHLLYYHWIFPEKGKEQN